MTQLSPEDALVIAKSSEPQPSGSNLLIDSAFQDDHGIALGSRVSITPESFGSEPTEGELIAATRTHYSLRREDPRAGVVHVHFPRLGYVLRAASAG
jgi:hypothetical protein